MVQHNAGKGLPSAMIGTERETFIREFLKVVFPPQLRFVGGAIIDSISNQVSGQIDIAVLLPSAPSFPMPSTGDQRLVLAENVAAVIEVKSDLSRQWAQCLGTVAKIRALRKYVREANKKGVAVVTTVPIIAVGYEGWKDVWALKAHWEKEDPANRPDAVCTIGSPAFVSSYLQAEGHAALFSLILYISQTIERQAAIVPDLMRYCAFAKM